MQLRILRYYRELLGVGYQCALHPDQFPWPLRGERIALGIDLAELDTIPLWSSMRPDGAVGIPMVGLVLERFDRSVAAFCDALELGKSKHPEDLHDARRALRQEMDAVLPRAEKSAHLARRADVYIPAERLQRICGRRGLLERILAGCESLLESVTDQAS